MGGGKNQALWVSGYEGAGYAPLSCCLEVQMLRAA